MDSLFIVKPGVHYKSQRSLPILTTAKRKHMKIQTLEKQVRSVMIRERIGSEIFDTVITLRSAAAAVGKGLRITVSIDTACEARGVCFYRKQESVV